MPSRLGVAAILLFWAATTAVVIDREVVPRYFSDGPPAARIDLVDEATAQTETKWTLYREVDGAPVKVGGLAVTMTYDPGDDSFDYKNEYRDLKLPVGGLTLAGRDVVTNVRVSRAGRLREQHLKGKLDLRAQAGPTQFLTMGEVEAEVHARVRDGTLAGELALWLPSRPPYSGRKPDVSRPLDPVPVPDGQALNPLQPVNRLRGVRPGRRWTVREADPLRAALGLAVQDLARSYHLPVGLPAAAGGAELRAAVRPAAERLVLTPPPGGRPPGQAPPPPADCWVIDYKGDGVAATTWVSVADGRVLRQEAGALGERLWFERDY